jgi:hypothetical protein
MKRDLTGRYVRPPFQPEPFEAFVPKRDRVFVYERYLSIVSEGSTV